jgi:hypothetical protein
MIRVFCGQKVALRILLSGTKYFTRCFSFFIYTTAVITYVSMDTTTEQAKKLGRIAGNFAVCQDFKGT